MTDDYKRFVEGTVDSYTVDLRPPVGEVEIRADSVVCYADRGGWHWQAEGVDRGEAARRLESRLQLSPFDGLDTDWGDPGYKIGDLDPAIPEVARARMEEWARIYESWWKQRMEFA